MTVLTLVLLMPAWEQFWKPKLEARIANLKLRKAVYWTLEMAGLSLLAQIGSAPIVALSYNEFSLVGFFANLGVVPLLFLLIPLGFFGALIWNIWPLAGAGLLALAGEGLRAVVWVVRSCGELGWAYRAMPTPNLYWILLYYLGVVGLAWTIGRVVQLRKHQH